MSFSDGATQCIAGVFAGAECGVNAAGFCIIRACASGGAGVHIARIKPNALRNILTVSILAATPAFAQLQNYWALDEVGGTNIPNSVGGGPNGTTFNGATWVTDATRGQVLDFDGNDGYADLGFIPQPPCPACSYCASAKPERAPAPARRTPSARAG